MPYDQSKDAFSGGYAASLICPAQDGAPVTPSNTVDLPAYAKSLHIGGAGDVTLVPLRAPTDTGVLYAGLQAGQTLPVACRRVLATGTTATNIVAHTK